MQIKSMGDIYSGADLETLTALLAATPLNPGSDSVMYFIGEGNALLGANVCTGPATNTESPIRNVLCIE